MDCNSDSVDNNAFILVALPQEYNNARRYPQTCQIDNIFDIGNYGNNESAL